MWQIVLNRTIRYSSLYQYFLRKIQEYRAIRCRVLHSHPPAERMGIKLVMSFSHEPQEGSVLLANDSPTVAQVPLPSGETVAKVLHLMCCSDLTPALAAELFYTISR